MSDSKSIPHKQGKHDNASNTTNLVSVCPADGVTLSGLTRLKSVLRMECDELSLILRMAVYVVDTVS